MNRNTIIGIMITVLVMGGLMAYVIPQITKDPTSMTITLYDADGNAVYVSSTDRSRLALLSNAITLVDGQIVETAVVTIDYTVTGIDNTATLEVGCGGAVTTYLNTYTGGTVMTNAVVSTVETAPSGQWTFTYVLATLVVFDNAGMENGWGIDFSYDLTATATLADGSTKSASLSLSQYLGLRYVADTGGGGDIVLDATLDFGTN